MSHSIEAIAEAFSTHRFAEAQPHLSAGVVWNNVGTEELVGRDTVLARCQQSAEDLVTVSTTFTQVRVTAMPACVVVETVARYEERDRPVSRVASCDIYRFSGTQIDEITSYNVELK